jgi:hypothetical protein
MIKDGFEAVENILSLWTPSGRCTTNVRFPTRRVAWRRSFEIHCGPHPNYSFLYVFLLSESLCDAQLSSLHLRKEATC